MPLNDQALELVGSTKETSQQHILGSANPLALATEPPASTAFEGQSFNISGDSNDFLWPFVPDSSLMSNPLDESHPVNLDLWQSGNTRPGMIAPATPMTVSQDSSAFPASTAAIRSPESQQGRTECSWANSASDEVFTEAITCRCFPGLLAAMQDIGLHVNTSASALDTVLCASRTAAKHCVASLRCEYSIRSRTNVSCVAIASGLLDRILASYQSALKAFCAEIEGDDEDDQSEMEGDEDHNHTLTTNDAIQLKLGRFTVEKGEQVLWARNIVAREIGKVQDGVRGCATDGPKVRGILIEHISKRCSLMIEEFGSKKDM